MSAAVADRLAKLDTLTLALGGHASFEAGACAMEAVAWLAGEEHSDAPQCACPVIARAVIRLNDSIKDAALRTELLRPLLPRIIGSRASRDVMVRRGYVAADMAVRVFAPMALEKRGRLDLATILRGCAEVKDQASAIAARDTAREVRNSAAAYGAYAYAAAAAAADVAADAADVAADGAYAYAYAAAAAAAAADVAADAAYAADDDAYARRPIYELAVQMIEKMLAVTESP